MSTPTIFTSSSSYTPQTALISPPQSAEEKALIVLFDVLGKFFNLTRRLEKASFVAQWFNIRPVPTSYRALLEALPDTFVNSVTTIFSTADFPAEQLRQLMKDNNLSFTERQQKKMNAQAYNEFGGVEESKQEEQSPAADVPETVTSSPQTEGMVDAPTQQIDPNPFANPFVTPARKRRRTRKLSMGEKTDEVLDTTGLANTLLSADLQANTEAVKAQTEAMSKAVAAMTAQPPQPTDTTEESNAIDQSALTVDRQNEMTANEAEALTFHSDYVEKLDVTNAYLLRDQDRGNVGAGTAASAPTADLWGFFPSAARPDKLVPENTLDVRQDGNVIDGDTEKPEADKFTFLPFAKLGGSIVWIPRNVDAARFFFTSSDYDELASNVEDGNPLTLPNEDMVDISYMLDSITKLYMSLHLFCNLAPMLTASMSNRQQIYAEWLELRQISRALVAYEQNTAGMYENASVSMRGGIRAAVGAALKPLYEKLKVPEEAPSPAPLSASFGGNKQRAGEMGIVKDGDFNPQFNFEPVSFKRTKFSIPTI